MLARKGSHTGGDGTSTGPAGGVVVTVVARGVVAALLVTGALTAVGLEMVGRFEAVELEPVAVA
jgi:hypothetical protein